MAKQIQWFKDINTNHINTVGENAAKLGELYSNNFPVNLGFAITTNAFDEFIDATGIRDQITQILSQTNISEPSNLINASKKVRESILNATIPAYLQDRILTAYHNLETGGERFNALNSAAYEMISAGRAKMPDIVITTAPCSESTENYSFAGTIKNYTNIQGDENLLQTVKKAWASLFSPQTLFYFQKNGFQEMTISLTIQKMFESEQSANSFSVNPVNGKDEIIIEAIWGMPEPLIHGELNPNTYTVDSESFAVQERKINKQPWAKMKDLRTMKETKKDLSIEKSSMQVISDEVIKKIASTTKRVQKHFTKPQSILFSVLANRIYILGIREIRTKEQSSFDNFQQTSGGVIASRGKASGKAKFIADPEELSNTESNLILTTKNLSTKIIPYFSNIEGIISSNGGLSSELAVLARELGKPVITQTDITGIDENTTVTLDAFTGNVSPNNLQPQTITDALPFETSQSFAFAEPVVEKTEMVTPPSFDYNIPEQAKTLPSNVVEQTAGINITLDSFEPTFLQELVLLCAKHGVNISFNSNKKKETTQITPKEEPQMPVMPFW